MSPFIQNDQMSIFIASLSDKAEGEALNKVSIRQIKKSINHAYETGKDVILIESECTFSKSNIKELRVWLDNVHECRISSSDKDFLLVKDDDDKELHIRIYNSPNNAIDTPKSVESEGSDFSWYNGQGLTQESTFSCVDITDFKGLKITTDENSADETTDDEAAAKTENKKGKKSPG